MFPHSDSGYAGSHLGKMTRRGSYQGQRLFPHTSESNGIPISGQFPLNQVDYRDNYERSSISTSMPDNNYQSNFGLSPDEAINPDLDGSTALLGLAMDSVNQNVSLDEISLQNMHMTQAQTYDLPDVPQRAQPFTFSMDDSVIKPWNQLALEEDNNITMKRPYSLQHTVSPYDVKRRRGNSNTSHTYNSRTPTATSPSSSQAQNNIQYLTQGSQYDPGPCYPEPSLVGNIFEPQASYPLPPSQDEALIDDPVTSTRVTLKPSRSSRNKEKKYSCDYCDPLKSFTTTNDRDRHHKTVHKIVRKGEHIYICQYSPCLNQSTVKKWVRLDNFKQHVVRIHGDEYKEDAEKMRVEYDPGIHGPMEPSKGKSSDQLFRETNELSTSEIAEGNVNIDARLSGCYPIGTDSTIQLQQFMRQNPRHNLQTSRSSMTNNPGSDPSRGPNRSAAVSTSSVYETSQLNRKSPRHLHPVADPVISRKMYGQRVTGDRCTLANPETYSRQQREMVEQDNTSSDYHLTGSASAEFEFMGQVLEDNNLSMTMDPADLSARDGITFNDAHTIFLGTHGTPAIGPVDSLGKFLDELSEAQRKRLLKLVPPELIASSADRKPSPSRSLPAIRSPNTRRTGSQKLLECSKMMDVNGIERKCQKTFNKRSELRKHEKRHLRRYGCTFDHCYKRFGTKWEWKRHEFKQHCQHEAWRCSECKDGQICAQVFNEKSAFGQHLHEQHKLRQQKIEQKVEECRLAKKWLGSYFCGICNKICKSQAAFGSPMDKERYDHISSHLDSAVAIDEDLMDTWIEVEGKGMTKGELKKYHAKGELKVPPHIEGGHDYNPESSEDTSSDSEEDEVHSQPVAQREPPRLLTDSHRLHSRSSSSPNNQQMLSPQIQLISPEGLVSTPPGQYQQPQPSHARPDSNDTRLVRLCCGCNMPNRVFQYTLMCPAPSCEHEYCEGCMSMTPTQQVMQQLQQNYQPQQSFNDFTMYGAT